LVISYIIYRNHLQMRIVNYTGSRFLRLELLQVGCCFYSYQNRGTKCLNEFYKNIDLFSTRSWWDKCGWTDRQGACLTWQKWKKWKMTFETLSISRHSSDMKPLLLSWFLDKTEQNPNTRWGKWSNPNIFWHHLWIAA
jgi:hypothetical protein